jgi:hypothetical protein
MQDGGNAVLDPRPNAGRPATGDPTIGVNRPRGRRAVLGPNPSANHVGLDKNRSKTVGGIEEDNFQLAPVDGSGDDARTQRRRDERDRSAPGDRNAAKTQSEPAGTGSALIRPCASPFGADAKGLH